MYVEAYDEVYVETYVEMYVEAYVRRTVRTNIMEQIKNAKACELIKDFSFPKYSEIPNVGLFLDQVNKYVNEYLKPLTGISITPSMISNYVKKGLLDNPIKKQYYRDHIIYVFFIAIAKSVLSLEEIEILINSKNRDYDCKYLYEYFCVEFENVLFNVFGINDSYEETELSPTQDRILLHNAILTSAHKIYLDTIFMLKSKDGEDDGKQ